MHSSTSSMTSKGQITIPKAIRDRLHLDQGDKVEFIFTENNEVLIKPMTKKVTDVAGRLGAYKKDSAVSLETMQEAIQKRMKNNVPSEHNPLTMLQERVRICSFKFQQ